MPALAIVAPVLGDLPVAYRYVPLVASVVLFGLPHGAVVTWLDALTYGPATRSG